MSKLQRTLIADRIVAVAKVASRNGDKFLATNLVNLGTLYLYQRDDLLKLVNHSTDSAVDIAKEESSYRRGVSPPGNREAGKVEEALESASNAAVLAEELQLGGVISFINAIRTVQRDDLLEQLYDVASYLSHSALGKKPEKEVLIVVNELDEDDLEPLN